MPKLTGAPALCVCYPMFVLIRSVSCHSPSSSSVHHRDPPKYASTTRQRSLASHTATIAKGVVELVCRLLKVVFVVVDSYTRTSWIALVHFIVADTFSLQVVGSSISTPRVRYPCLSPRSLGVSHHCHLLHSRLIRISASPFLPLPHLFLPLRVLHFD